METIKVVAMNSRNQNEQEEKILQAVEKKVKNWRQRALHSTHRLSNHLPRGTLLAYHLLSPVVTRFGYCNSLGRSLSIGLLMLCGVSCFVLNFTDSFRDNNGNISYGIVTAGGLWVIDGSATVSCELAAKYRLHVVDFVHAFLSLLVFATVALLDRNVTECFFPTHSFMNQLILTILPGGISVICSVFFIVFPSKRHGIGFALSSV